VVLVGLMGRGKGHRGVVDHVRGFDPFNLRIEDIDTDPTAFPLVG